MASSIFLVYVFPSIAWARNSLPHHPLASRVWDRALRSGVGSWGWPTGSPNVGVLVELTQNGSSSRLLSLFGRVTSMISGPIPVAVFQHSTCVTLWALLCPTCGVTSSPPSVSRRWFESEVRHLLDDGLHNRATVGIASGRIHFYPKSISYTDTFIQTSKNGFIQ